MLIPHRAFVHKIQYGLVALDIFGDDMISHLMFKLTTKTIFTVTEALI